MARYLGFLHWRLILAILSFLMLLFLLADFFYRKTAGQQIVSIRVIEFSHDAMLTDSGQFDLRGYTRRYYGRPDIREKIRLGCKYDVAISVGLLAHLGFLFDGRSKFPFVEYVIRGYNEPELNCTNLYSDS
jgi:hypothetical protein